MLISRISLRDCEDSDEEVTQSRVPTIPRPSVQWSPLNKLVTWDAGVSRSEV